MRLRAPRAPWTPCSPEVGEAGCCTTAQGCPPRLATSTAGRRPPFGPAGWTPCPRQGPSEAAQSNWTTKRPKAPRARTTSNRRASNGPKTPSNPPRPSCVGRNAHDPRPTNHLVPWSKATPLPSRWPGQEGPSSCGHRAPRPKLRPTTSATLATPTHRRGLTS